MSRDDIERAVLVNEQQHDLMSAAETSGVIMHRTADGVWTELGTVEAADLAVNPSNVAEQVAPDYDASLWTSIDGALTWAPVEDAPPLVEVE